MPGPDIPESEKAASRRRALERLRRQQEAPQAALAGETEASLLSAFALADLLNGIRGR